MNLNGFGQKRRIFSSLLINQIVRFIFHPFLVSLSLFFLPSNVRLKFQKTIPAIGTFRERAMFIEQIGQK